MLQGVVPQKTIASSGSLLYRVVSVAGQQK